MEVHGKPKPVDSLVRQLVQVCLRIIVYVIAQLVDKKRLAIGRSEEAARDALPDAGTAPPVPRHGGGAIGGAQLLFEQVYGSAHALLVGGQQPGAGGVYVQIELLALQFGCLPETDKPTAGTGRSALGLEQAFQRGQRRLQMHPVRRQPGLQVIARGQAVPVQTRIAAATRLEVIFGSRTQTGHKTRLALKRLRQISKQRNSFHDPQSTKLSVT